MAGEVAYSAGSVDSCLVLGWGVFFVAERKKSTVWEGERKRFFGLWGDVATTSEGVLAFLIFS